MADGNPPVPALHLRQVKARTGKRLEPEALAHALAERLGYLFRDPERLKRALTHASARRGDEADYQRLEFLGDRVLGLVIAELVFLANPDAGEGELSRRLNALVNAETCALVAEEIGLPEFIRAGTGLRVPGGRKLTNLRGDVMESLIAAIYLDGGLEPARNFIRRYWEPRSVGETAARRDAKTELQEWAHQAAGAVPVYAIEERMGPDHEPVFRIVVEVTGFPPARGEGRSKREAEQLAAAAMLVREGVWPIKPEAA